LSLNRFDKPVIAAINGATVAGGLTLALCCDFRIASDQARLGDTALKFGLLCDEGGAYLLPRAMGLDRALKMTLLSGVYEAKTALDLGLVTEVVPHANLTERAEELARRLAEGPPLAIRTAKRMMYKQQDMTLPNALEDAALNVMITNPSEDVREGTRAFKEKRKRHFKGREKLNGPSYALGRPGHAARNRCARASEQGRAILGVELRGACTGDGLQWQ